MKLELQVAAKARAFEQQAILPLLGEMSAEPTRHEVELNVGDIAFCVNHQHGWAIGDTWFWQPLEVRYRDANDKEDAAFRLRCCSAPDVHLTQAEIMGVVRLQLDDDGVAWHNPLDGRRLFRFKKDEPHKLLVNAWYLFRGSVLPMLYQQTYRFNQSATEAVLFQQIVIRQMRAAWEKTE